MKKIIYIILMLLLNNILFANDLDKKKELSKKQYKIDKNYLNFGVLPNNSGNIDGFVSGKLFYSKRLLSWIEFETTTIKKDKQYYDSTSRDFESDFKFEKKYKLKFDILSWRFIDTGNTNKKMTMSITPYAGFDYNHFVNRFVNLLDTGTNSYIYNEEQELLFVEAYGKLNISYTKKNKFYINIYGAGGVIFGFLWQNFINSEDGNTEEFDNYSDFINPAFSLGGKIYYNFGPLALSLEGSYTRTAGPLFFYEWDTDIDDYVEYEETFKFTIWNIRIEIILNFLNLGGSHPALFFSASSSKFEVGGYNLIARFDDDSGKEINVVYKFGVTMKF